MLWHTDHPVTYIGTSVGWPDQNYFGRRFKAHYGPAASTYRARFSQTLVQPGSWPSDAREGGIQALSRQPFPGPRCPDEPGADPGQASG
jgi:hypothetical protein